MVNNVIDVSIVIVCMNNLKNLYPCLDSIKKYTSVSYETFVVAYLFSKENLDKLRKDYPWITIVESNEIRGFSENNNLALRQAKGKYCFVVNDDTEMKMPVIDVLVKTIEELPQQVAIVSPTLESPNGKVQVCGRPYSDWKTIIRTDLHLSNKKNINKYCNKTGVFQTYNIIGAAFLIKTEIFQKEGFFDERYFFCPEDIALSTKLNKMGYECYVNNDVKIIHYEGMSGKTLSIIQTATKPAHAKGMVIFYSEGNKKIYRFLSVYVFFHALLQFFVHGLIGLIKKRPNKYSILAIGELNITKTILTKATPKEIFIKVFEKINK